MKAKDAIMRRLRDVASGLVDVGSGAMSCRERVRCALGHEEPDRVPVDFWAVPEVWERLRDFCGVGTGEEVLDLLHVDLRWVRPEYAGPPPRRLPDGTYFDVWGTHRRDVHNQYGVYAEYAGSPLGGAQSPADVEGFSWPRPEYWDTGALPDQIRALNSAEEHFVCYEVGGIFELSWGLRGYERFLTDLAVEPDIACAIMDRITDIYIANVTRVLQAAAGEIDMVYTYDDVGTQAGLLLSPRMWRQYILPRHRRLNAAIRQFDVKIMYHSCGAVFPLIEAFVDEMDIDVLNPIQPRAEGMDPACIKRAYGDRLSFYGAIDIQQTMPHGEPADVRLEARERCRTMGVGGGYIMATAHNMQADTPLDNILALYHTPRQVTD